MTTLTDLQHALPASVGRRFLWVGAFVSSVVAEIEAGTEHKGLSPQRMRTLQLVTFIWLLGHFLEDGSKAAENAVAELKRLDIPRLRIGSTVFEEGNESVQLGRTLARELRKTCPARTLFAVMDRAKGPRRAIQAAYEALRNG